MLLKDKPLIGRDGQLASERVFSRGNIQRGIIWDGRGKCSVRVCSGEFSRGGYLFHGWEMSRVG